MLPASSAVDTRHEFTVSKPAHRVHVRKKCSLLGWRIEDGAWYSSKDKRRVTGVRSGQVKAEETA